MLTIESRKSSENMARIKRNDVAVKIDAEVVRTARHLAIDQGITLAKYLSDRIRPHVEADFEALRKRIGQAPEKRPKGSE